MAIDSLLAYFAISLLCMVSAWAILATSGFYRRHIDSLALGRHQMIDGLRGWLALGVFMTHIAALYFYYKVGAWAAEEQSDFLRMTGEVGVCLFFMITGFLFWGRVLRQKGDLDVAAFLESRIRRLVPMYVVSVVMVLAVVAVLSGLTLRVEPTTLVKEIRAWFSFGFMHAGGINGVDGHQINVVYWTLRFEWLFYLALPLLAFFVRKRVVPLLTVLALVFCPSTPITFNFVFGALAAASIQSGLFGDGLARWWMTPIPLAALVSVFLFPSAYSLAPTVVMFVFFLFVVHGNSLFGLLATKGAKLLGVVSYSIYLVNNIVAFSVMYFINRYEPIATMSTSAYLLFAAIAAIITVVLSAATYRFVEHPFLSKRTTEDGRGALAQKSRAWRQKWRTAYAGITSASEGMRRIIAGAPKGPIRRTDKREVPNSAS
jgi:peptidoglycan/LPS O-acetylase OafA/YrhL